MGSQMTPRSPSAWTSKPRWMSPRLCSTLAWLSITPLGLPVEPEVYCRKARPSRSTRGSRQASSMPGGSSSVASQCSRPSSGASAARWPRLATTLAVESATFGWASAAMLCRRAVSRFKRGGKASTATAPA